MSLSHNERAALENVAQLLRSIIDRDDKEGQGGAGRPATAIHLTGEIRDSLRPLFASMVETIDAVCTPASRRHRETAIIKAASKARTLRKFSREGPDIHEVSNRRSCGVTWPVLDGGDAAAGGEQHYCDDTHAHVVHQCACGARRSERNDA